MTKHEAELALLEELRELLRTQAASWGGWLGIGIIVFSWCVQKQKDLEADQ